MEDKNTLCWNCDTAYPAFYDTCPKCGATNANVDLHLARAEIDNPALIVSPEKASLIAAAPELFDALVAIVTTWETGLDFSNEIGEARAAIAKATGA